VNKYAFRAELDLSQRSKRSQNRKDLTLAHLSKSNWIFGSVAKSITRLPFGVVAQDLGALRCISITNVKGPLEEAMQQAIRIAC